MADQLTVDLAGLEGLASNLDTMRRDLASQRSWLREFDGDFGGRDVDRSLDHFESHWNDGRQVVSRNCERIVELARQAVESIRKTDDDLAKQLETS